eukprot:TRINITY_DN4298_c2_g1_i1.p1 TRINITY_DN4298_c2_g1~~TRINITY_DN4298_c2_g1_i1.p1  ORF type:complete len:278 (+),score=4.07 TRINITY_DN4298_c2_g1_i1:266-1099(+)
MQSVPKSDRCEPQTPLSDFQFVLAYDPQRHRLLLHDSFAGLLSSVAMDGTLLASVVQHDRPRQVLINRASGTYIVLGYQPLVRVQVLDSDLNVVTPCAFIVEGLDEKYRSSFAIDSGGRIFFLSAAPVGLCVSSVDVATGTATTVIDSAQLHQPGDKLRGLVVDSHDRLVMWYRSGRIATYTAEGRLLLVFNCEDRPGILQVSADGIFAVQAWSYTSKNTMQFFLLAMAGCCGASASVRVPTRRCNLWPGWTVSCSFKPKTGSDACSDCIRSDGWHR